jgi:hypothetical protein
MKFALNIFCLCLFFLPCFGTIAQEAESEKSKNSLVSASFSWYPIFKFGSKDLDENLTDARLASNVATNLQFGLKLFKNFKFLFDVNIDGSSIDESPFGYLSKFSGLLGYKRAVIGFRSQSISGSYVWKGEKTPTGPNGRSNFAINISAIELQYDISYFITLLTKDDTIGGLYLGLLYLTYDGISKYRPSNLPVYANPHAKFSGWGLTMGIDTLTAQLLYGYSLPSINLDKKGKIILMPWIHLSGEWAFGNEELSDETIAMINENPEIPRVVKDDLETSDFGSWFTMDFMLGAGIKYKTKWCDYNFAIGYGGIYFVRYFNDTIILDNVGLTFKASIVF